MGAFDDLISKHSGSQSSGAFDDLVQKYGNQTPQEEGFGSKLKDYGNAVSSALGLGIFTTQSGVASFLQAPAANTLSGLKSGVALFDRGFTSLVNASGGEAALHKETQEDAQKASAFAAETRADNVKNNVVARAFKSLENDGRERSAEVVADDEKVNPNLIAQQKNITDANGFIGTLKASVENPLALTHILTRSLPDMALGLGAGRLVASRALAAGAGAGEAAAARVAAAGGDVAAQEIAAKAAIEAVQAQATRAASTAGITAEAGTVGLSSRESSYTQVKQIPFAKLAESPRFKELYDQTGSAEQAREILANEVADSTPLLSAGLTGLGTVITNKLYGGDATAKVLAGVEKPTLKAVAKDISQEGVEEVVQGVPQGFSDHTAMQIADPTKQFDLGGEIAQNFLGGIALGGAGHGSAYAKQKFNDARSGVADAIKSRYEEQLAEKLTGKTAPEVTDTYEPSAPKLNEAEKALATPNSITPLDRVQEIDMRLNKLSPENGYGETFDAERNDLQQERNAITQAFPKIVSGAPTSFSTEAGAKLDAQYALIEAGDLQTSHDENLRANPNYPAALQPRERDRASSATQIAGIVQKIDPARLGISADAATGAPIIGADGLVESGNARSIALKRIYRVPGQKAEDYKAYLTANAAQFGLDSAQIGALEKPVLVRVRNTPVDRAEFARQANASTVARMSSVEQARADSKRLDVLDDLNPTENGDFSNSHDFIRRFLSKTPQTEHGDLIDSDGRLSSSGYARVRNAVLAKAYGDSPVILRLTESLDDNLRNVSKALLQVAPKVAQVRASIGEGNLHDADITPDLLGAVEELSRIKDKGQSVSQYLGQSGIFDDKLTPEGKELLQFLDENIRRPKQMAEFILRYTEALEAQGNPNQADIFGDNTAPTKGELLNVAKREQYVESIAGQGRNQESEVPTGSAGIEREDTRGSQESDQGNDAATRGEADEIINAVQMPISEVKRKNGAIGTQGVTETQIREVLKNVAGMQISDTASMREMVNAFKNDKAAISRLLEFTKNNPVEVITLPDGSLHLKDGHHRTFLLDQAGITSVPAIGYEGEVKDDEAVFKANSTAVLGLTVDALTSQVKAITDQWKNAPKSNVVESPSELPFAAPSDARGAYYKGEIYLVASNLRSQEDAQMVLFHEALGHAGLRGAFGESLTPSLRKLAIDNLSIAKAAAEWRKENSDIRGKKTEDLWLTTSVEEVLADIAGQGKPLKGFDQFLAKVQSGLRAIGLNHVADWLSKHTNAEVLRLLTAARKHIIAGNKSHVFGKDEAKAFSIDPDADKSAEAALEEIAKIGDAFAYPKSESNTVEGITADIDSSINVRKLTNIPGETRYEFSMPDGSTARMMVRPFNKYGKSVYGFELDANNEMTGQVDERPGKFPEEAHGKGDVWIDVSLLKEGKGYGAKLYQIAANYAHNTDQVFIGDPAGISREALIRRPEQMLSSALKFGTTEHLAPHPMQIKGDKKNGIAPLDWVYGDHIGNIQKLIDATLQNIDNGGGIGGIEYDKRTGEFIDGAGTGITRQDLFGLAEAGLARSVQAGGRTLARYAFLKSILPAHRSGERARRESGALLVRLSQQLRDHVSTLAQNVGADPKGKAIFYSRGRDDRTGDLFGVPDSDRTNLVERASANGPERESTRTTFLRANSGNLPGDYGTVVENRIGKIEKVGVDRVNSAADAANVTASLTDLAREHLDILVTGKNGKVLAIQRMFAGSKSASAVYPEEIIAFVNSIPNAESYWASHNHPGGKHDFSLTDNRLTGEIQRLSDGVTPEFKGLLALSKSKFSHTVDGKSSVDGDIPALPKTKKVSYVEQSFVKSDKLGEAISSPSKARNIVASVSKGRSGIVLADVQNAPVAFFPLDFAIAGKLKGTPIARDILAAVARSNANSAFLVTGEKVHPNETRNVGTLLSRAKVRVIDAFNNDSLNNESYRSAAEMGRALENSDDVLFSREGKDASMEEIDKKIAAAQAKYNKNKTPLTEGNLLDLLRKKEALINNQIKPTQETKPKQEDDYRDPHKAPTVEAGAQGNDLTKVYPDDIYSAKAAQYYGDGSQLDKTTIKTVQSWRGKPNAEVTIYRAVPKSAPDAINAGDWVGINRQYAENHGDGPLNGDYKIVSKKVKVSEIYTKGDSIQEWGYHPSNDDVKFSRVSDATNEQEALSHVGTVAERANAIIQKSAATPAPIEAVVKAAVKLTQFDKLTSAIYDGAGFILDRFTPETVKAGFVSDYGVPEAVIDRRTTLSAHMNVQTRKAGKLIDQLASLTREESRVAYEWMNNSNPEALKHFEEQLPPESVAVLADVKKMIDDLSKEAISLGQLSKEAYDKNSMEYLRRSYEKHIVGIDKKEQKARTRALSILGDQYKGRGLVELASMKQIQNLAPDWWNRKLVDGKADKQLKGEKFIRLERHAPSGEGTIPLEGLGDKQKGKLQEVVYYPAGEAIPAKYAEWTEAGTFEVRDTKGGDAVLWRDFTKEERVKMGEIDEARFAIAKTLHGMIHDVEVGRYLEWVNRKYGLTHKEQVPGKVVKAHELTLTTFGAVYKPGDWVKVPNTEIDDTDVKKYGALSGKYIPGPIWNDVRQIGTGSFKPFGETYSTILRFWKTSKTALSPAVHMNNVMANFVMADWHDVSAGHIHKALRILLASHDREGVGAIGKVGNAAARLGIVDREAAKEILGRYQDSGGNIGTYASKELQNEQIQPLLDAIEREMAENGESPTAQVGVMNALQFLRHGEVSAAYQAAIGSKGAKAIGNEAKNLIDLYQSEDDVFRLAAWLKAKEDGATDIEAGKKSRKSFLDYNINAPWVAAMRSTAFPFIAFSYRAIPMLAETAAKRPWKLLKLTAIVGGLNALSYALIGGDEDDERRYLPEEKAGRVWGMVPKLIRMPFDTDGQPVFLDIRRFIPVGDVFDLGQGHSAVPVPPSMMPGGPMMLLFEAMLNKSAFTGKEISLETDTTFERLMKTGDYLYKAVAPNIAFLPGTYSYENITNAGKGKTDTFGRELSINQALLNSVGIKVGSYGADTLRYNAGKKLEGELREIDANIHGLSREYSKKGLTYDEFIEKATKQQDKKKAIIEKYRAK